MKTHSYCAYIDESGDEGLKQRKGGTPSEWFVLSAVVCKEVDDPGAFSCVDDVKEAMAQNSHRPLNKKIPLHFCKMKHPARKHYVSLIAKAPVICLSVCFDKSVLVDDLPFRDGRLYHYMTRVLLERVSWLCRDSYAAGKTKGDGTLYACFSNRAATKYDELKSYLDLLASDPARFEYTAAPGVIRSDQICSLTAGARKGLQIADAVASSTYQALTPDAYGNTESAYLEALSPVMYRRKGNLFAYGLKLLPPAAEARRKRGEITLPLA